MTAEQHRPDDEPSDASNQDDTDRAPDIPVDAVVEAERLTRLARNAADRADQTSVAGETSEGPDEATLYLERRDDMVAEYSYTTRLRESDDTLVLYPEEWVEDGVVQFDRIDDTDRAVELPLSGPGSEEEWADVEAHNSDLVQQVADEHGEDHAANARAFADFVGNHYAKEMERTTAGEITEFLTEYYPRNVWPSATQESVVEKSVKLVFDAAGVEPPAFEATR